MILRSRCASRAVALVVALASWFACALPARAWNASGHMLIALVAYEALPAEQRREWVELLDQHPRFEADFAAVMPSALESDAERERWIFAHAAVWPDLARGQAAYEQPVWHYVNLPLGLHRGRLNSCQQARQAFEQFVLGPARAAPAAAPSNILSALSHNQRQLADRTLPPAARALALSWLLHLVADAHQPLHGVALFSERRFPTGDRGGNDIVSKADGVPLHRGWDDLLGEETSLRALTASARELSRGPLSKSKAPIGAATFDTWIDEDCELARSQVYVPAVLAAVTRHEAALPGGDVTSSRPAKPEVALSRAYWKAARDVARRRAQQAGLRLAAALREL